ncbi:hypothetical protein HHI36_008043 [Cryptolaemus montrouzieri]|uniref:Uncharacterized protein n=1 Tax=Cryptolaemus montrouzieri TaxID=559131 RepID=A0ABD2MRW1_9CUCU
MTSRQFGSVTIIGCASVTVGAEIWELNNSAAAAANLVLDVVVVVDPSVIGLLSIYGISVISKGAKSLSSERRRSVTMVTKTYCGGAVSRGQMVSATLSCLIPNFG